MSKISNVRRRLVELRELLPAGATELPLVRAQLDELDRLVGPSGAGAFTPSRKAAISRAASVRRNRQLFRFYRCDFHSEQFYAPNKRGTRVDDRGEFCYVRSWSLVEQALYKVRGPKQLRHDLTPSNRHGHVVGERAMRFVRGGAGFEIERMSYDEPRPGGQVIDNLTDLRDWLDHASAELAVGFRAHKEAMKKLARSIVAA